MEIEKRGTKRRRSTNEKLAVAGVSRLLAFKRKYNRRGRGTSPELKNTDTLFNGALAASSAVAQVQAVLNDPIQGTSGTTRLGRKITMKSLLINVVLNYNFGTAGAPLVPGTATNFVRIIVYYDKQTNAANPAIGDVLLVDAVYSPMNLSNSDRFKVIWNWHGMMTCPPGATGPNDNSIIHFSKYIRLNNLDTMYNTTNGGSVADITTGGLFAIFYVTGIKVQGDIVNSSYMRVRFTDV